MSTLREKRPEIFAVLSLLLALTRFGHVGSHVTLPDASWAVFFLAGFYLPRQRAWAFPALMLLAVAVDLVAIFYFGVSNYCLTVAYWFIVPAYALLWLGGSWLRARFSFDARGAGLLIASLLVAVSACDLVTNGSFYWLGGRVADPNVAGWLQDFRRWYFRFLEVPFGYVAAAAAVHALALQLRGALHHEAVSGRG